MNIHIVVAITKPLNIQDGEDTEMDRVNAVSKTQSEYKDDLY